MPDQWLTAAKTTILHPKNSIPFLASILLVVGLVAAALLINQAQDVRQQAQGCTYGDCQGSDSTRCIGGVQQVCNHERGSVGCWIPSGEKCSVTCKIPGQIYNSQKDRCVGSVEVWSPPL